MHPPLPTPAPPCWYDAAAAEKAVAFFPENLALTKGEWAGRPFVLADWQARIVRHIFGWKRPDGRRQYRTLYLEVPRKNGKTELAAGLAVLMMLADGEVGGEGYALASRTEQAEIVFAQACRMVSQSPTLGQYFEPLKTALFCPDLMASFKPLSGNPEGKHGKNPSFLIGDELHEWVDDRLYTFLRQGMGARRQPLTVLITTAGTRAGFGWQMHTYAAKIADGVIEDPETLVVIYGAGPDDDWSDPEVWARANPNLGTSLKLEFLEAEARRAREDVRAENDFRRYHLNQWVEQDVRWLRMDKWRACASGPEENWRALAERMTGRPCYVGVDLSSTTDLTAIAFVFPPAAGDARWSMVWQHFVPAENMAARVRKDRVPYDIWAGKGIITATPGDVVDYEFVLHAIQEAGKRYKIVQIGVDPWAGAQFIQQLQGEGLPVIEYRQGMLSFAGPTKEFEKLVLGGEIDHGNNPLVTWMASNVAVKTDPAGNIKPDKQKSTERIDGVVAAIMGLGLALNAERPQESYLEKDELIVLSRRRA